MDANQSNLLSIAHDFQSQFPLTKNTWYIIRFTSVKCYLFLNKYIILKIYVCIWQIGWLMTSYFPKRRFHYSLLKLIKATFENTRLGFFKFIINSGYFVIYIFPNDSLSRVVYKDLLLTGIAYNCILAKQDGPKKN